MKNSTLWPTLRKFYSRESEKDARSSRRATRRRNRRALRLESLEGRRLLAAGDLDPSFGDDGRVLTDIGVSGGSDIAYDTIAYQLDGKLLVAGRSPALIGGASLFTVMRYNDDGSLDNSFGTNGVAQVAFDGNAFAQSVEVDSQDRIIVAGSLQKPGAGYDFAVARLDPNGALDTTFDGDGKQTIDFGSANDQGFGVAIDSQDNVVVAGYSQQPGTGYDFAVARLDSTTGALDTSFDGDGKQTIDFGSSSDIGRGVAIDGLDNVVVVGSSGQSGTGNDFAVARIDSSGALDASFDGDGKQTIDFGSSNDMLRGVAIDGLDNVVVVGYSGQSGTGSDFAVARLDSSGALDTSFDSDGKQTIDFGSPNDFGFGVALDSQNNVVVAGYSSQTGTGFYDFAVVRLNSNGALDTSFDSDGRQTIDFGSTNDQGHGVAIDSKSNVVVAGYSNRPGTGNDFAIARLDSNGGLDGSFGNNGRVITDVIRSGTDDVGFGTVAYQSDGKVIVVGYSVSPSLDFAVVRYNAEGSLDTSFGSNGTVRIDFGNTSDTAQSVALDSQDRIIVAGRSYQSRTGTDFAVARLDSSGALDTSFDGDGKQTIDFGSTDDVGYGVAIDSQDNVVVVGQSYQPGTGRDFAVARLNSSGALDTSFGGDGRRTIDIGNNNTWDLGYGVAIDSRDNVVIAGYSYQPDTGSDLAVARLDASGALDTSFDGDGQQTIDFGSNEDYGYAVAIDSQDNVVVAGNSLQVGTGYDFAVARLNSTSGTLDTSFDTDGKQTIDFGSTHDFGKGAAIDGQGHIVIAGFSSRPGAGNDFAVTMLDSTGIVSWQQTIDFGSTNDVGEAVAIDGQGRVVVAGYSSQGTLAKYDFAVTRLLSNSDPNIDDATFGVAENTPDGTVIESIKGTDLDGDSLTYSIIGGTGQTAFAIDAANGAISVTDTALLDYETTNSFTLDILVDDGNGGNDTAQVVIQLLNQASISGDVFLDINSNGLREANEPGIDGVIIELRDAAGSPVLDAAGAAIRAITAEGGFYLFEDLEPHDYQLHEVQPSGVNDGDELLGSLDGTIPADDVMQLTLERTDAYDYTFAEIGLQVSDGDTASIGFWQNKHGQALIAAGGPELAEWLSTHLDNIFGDRLIGATGQDVADFYREELFKQKASKSAGPAKVDAQFMAVALATYFTSNLYAGTIASSFGFNVTDTGIGTKVVNVGANYEAFGLTDSDPKEMTIMQLLLATNALTDMPDEISGFASIYDRNGDGVIDSEEAALRSMANTIYTNINEGGCV